MARILIVDDVTPIREIVTAMLSKCGHRVFEAKNAEEALAIVQTKKVHVVLTDINMPGMNGIDLIKRIRRNDGLLGMPIVVLAKNAQDDNVELAKAAGAVDWIAKPFTEDGLINKLNQVLVDSYVD